MVLHKTYISKVSVVHSGFSLIEVLVVLALLGMVLGSTLFFSSDTYQRTAFLAEKDNVLVALQTARGKALNNSNEQPHGVALYPAGYNGYVIFVGATFVSANASLNTYIPASYPVTLEVSSPQEIVFEQLSGNASYNGQVILVDSNRTATTGIAVNYEGAILR
jgi:prepilin-type N-terminal cleavage/methylation domain-containing protein